ncbi:MAG: pyridoxamine 5'-phosphate oxidase family protein [Elusimicrobiota bacterium]|jgi:uncharacterized pyridoxamine 5'-phosphate oxidase family protein|nr:pyridoxamine 5'-phosphate oxidase family protein [Elusimicrobiota bacterium]
MCKIIILICLYIFSIGGVLYSKSPSKNVNVDKVVKFLHNSKVFYIATIDGDKPRVRPFGVSLNIDGKVAICTGAWKNVFKQIQGNPNVEISAMTPDGKWIRLEGNLINTTTKKNRNKFFDFVPSLKELYKDKIEDFQVLSFEKGIATIQNTDGEIETIEL